MLQISASDEWRIAHPGAMIGLLEVSGVAVKPTFPALAERKREVEAQLRAKYKGFTRAEFISLPVMSAYVQYYRRFEKTYHVLLQVESIILKEKNLPDVSPLVDANFSAEVETLVLTAGHDADRLREPLVMDVSREGDLITRMNGIPKAIHAGDMVMRDAQGISCSIIYGQDNRSPIEKETSHVLYVAYAPAGVPPERIEQQLSKIVENMRLFAPDIRVEQQHIISA